VIVRTEMYRLVYGAPVGTNSALGGVLEHHDAGLDVAAMMMGPVHLDASAVRRAK
jgi:hypothetical protein